jgi:hypothetical protein
VTSKKRTALDGRRERIGTKASIAVANSPLAFVSKLVVHPKTHAEAVANQQAP